MALPVIGVDGKLTSPILIKTPRFLLLQQDFNLVSGYSYHHNRFGTDDGLYIVSEDGQVLEWDITSKKYVCTVPHPDNDFIDYYSGEESGEVVLYGESGGGTTGAAPSLTEPLLFVRRYFPTTQMTALDIWGYDKINRIRLLNHISPSPLDFGGQLSVRGDVLALKDKIYKWSGNNVTLVRTLSGIFREMSDTHVFSEKVDPTRGNIILYRYEWAGPTTLQLESETVWDSGIGGSFYGGHVEPTLDGNTIFFWANNLSGSLRGSAIYRWDIIRKRYNLLPTTLPYPNNPGMIIPHGEGVIIIMRGKLYLLLGNSCVIVPQPFHLNYTEGRFMGGKLILIDHRTNEFRCLTLL